MSGFSIESLKEHIMNKLAAAVFAISFTLCTAYAFSGSAMPSDEAPNAGAEQGTPDNDSMPKDGAQQNTINHDSTPQGGAGESDTNE